MKRTLFIAVAALLVGLGWRHARAVEPFSLRSFILGMTLADFRATAFPDQAEWPDAKPVCSNDAAALDRGRLASDEDIRLSESQAKAGIVRCAFFYPKGSSLSPAGLVVAGVRSRASYVFVPSPSGSLRLACIIVLTGTENYDHIKSALLQKYRKPKFMIRDVTSSATGGTRQDERLRWSNGVSDIVLIQRDGGDDVMSLAYQHEDLTEELRMRLQAVEGSDIDTL